MHRANVRTPEGSPLGAQDLPALRALRERRAIGERLITTNARGEEVVVQVAASPLLVNGEIRGAVSLWHDISERERLLENLREGEERLRIAVESVNLGTWDLDLRTDVATRSLRHDKIWGYEEPMTEWGLEIAMRNVVPEDRQQITDAYARAMETGVLKHENRVIWPDGNIHWIDVDGRVYRDSDGRPVRVIGVVADVTERKAAEAEQERLLEEVRLRAAELASTIDSMADGVVIYDRAGRAQRMNEAAERMLGYTQEEYVATSGPEERAALLRVQGADGKPFPIEETPTWRALQGETSRGVVMVLHRRTGERIWVSASAAPICCEDGEAMGAVATFADITALRELQERQADLAHVISHDIRSPLTCVGGQAQMLLRILERGIADPERLKKSAAAINTGAKRMDAMIQDLVDLTRSESGQLEVKLAPVDLEPFTSDLVKRLRDVLDTSRIEVSISPDVPDVRADPNRLERVLTNLLSNAARYSDAPAPVVLSARAAGQEVIVSVTDRGVGIREKDLPHNFDRFYRVSATSKREGLGLGLYITRMLVEAMGGRIWVESTPGDGSTFSFSLKTSE